MRERQAFFSRNTSPSTGQDKQEHGQSICRAGQQEVGQSHGASALGALGFHFQLSFSYGNSQNFDGR